MKKLLILFFIVYVAAILSLPVLNVFAETTEEESGDVVINPEVPIEQLDIPDRIQAIATKIAPWAVSAVSLIGYIVAVYSKIKKIKHDLDEANAKSDSAIADIKNAYIQGVQELKNSKVAVDVELNNETLLQIKQLLTQIINCFNLISNQAIMQAKALKPIIESTVPNPVIAKEAIGIINCIIGADKPLQEVFRFLRELEAKAFAQPASIDVKQIETSVNSVPAQNISEEPQAAADVNNNSGTPINSAMFS